jgi:PAS domain S-box-containing protein
MQDKDKTKEQLINELNEIRQRITRLEALEFEYRRAEVERDHLLADEREQRALTEALHWAGAVLSSTLDFEKVLDHVMEQIGRVIPYKAACIMLIEGNTVRIFRWRGYSRFETANSVALASFDIADIPILRTIQETGWPLAVPYVGNHDDWVAKSGQSWVKSHLSVPIRTRTRLVGFLHVDSDTSGLYSQVDAERLQAFANQAAIALENARRYDQARQEIARRVKALKKERNFVSTILDTADALVIVLDVEGHIVRFNRACERTTGYAFDEVRGKCVWDLFLTPAEIEPVKSTFDKLKAGEFPNQDENQWFTRDGQPRLIAWSNTVLLDKGGAVEYVVGTGIDITERKRAEEERDKLIEELDAFAHTVAHDLQHLLTLIIGFADMLQEGCASMPVDKIQEHLQAIARNGRKMSSIINNLLLLAGVREGEVALKPLDMASIVAEVRQRLADMIEKHQPEIVLPDKWPAALGYSPWIEEVWVNYFSNALKYGGQPPHLELGATTEADGMVRFWIRDNGPGLTSEEQAQLFNPFTQLGQVPADGHGLGLSIVRRIVEKLGGQVGVESEGIPGQGSVFSFTLLGIGENGDE